MSGIYERILQNAIDSIELGIDDFRMNESKRLVSSMRNVFAGMLLLFKAKLADLSSTSDESLLKRDVQPKLVDGDIIWAGRGKKTVDYHQIKDRFGSLEIGVDWSRVDGAQRYRNNMEHYYDTETLNSEVVRQYILDCFGVTCDFMRNHLALDPQELFDAESWQFWMEEKGIFEQEQAVCNKLLDDFNWPTPTSEMHIREAYCPECASVLLKPSLSSDPSAMETTFRCGVCGHEMGLESLIIIACQQAENRENYDYKCPEVRFGECIDCGQDTYDSVEGECSSCGEGPFECERCGSSIPVEELSYFNGRLCGWCDHMIAKDD